MTTPTQQGLQMQCHACGKQWTTEEIVDHSPLNPPNDYIAVVLCDPCFSKTVKILMLRMLSGDEHSKKCLEEILERERN